MSKRKANFNSRRWKLRIEKYRTTGEMDEAILERLKWDRSFMLELFPALRPEPSYLERVNKIVHSFYHKAVLAQLNKPTNFAKIVNIAVPK